MLPGALELLGEWYLALFTRMLPGMLALFI